MKYFLIILFLFVAFGCAGTVTLKHPETGKIVTCDSLQPRNNEFCVNNYRSQGFQRVPS